MVFSNRHFLHAMMTGGVPSDDCKRLTDTLLTLGTPQHLKSMAATLHLHSRRKQSYTCHSDVPARFPRTPAANLWQYSTLQFTWQNL